MEQRRQRKMIGQRSEAEIARRTAELLATAPTGIWPYGMPCALWPELVVVGISPGNSPAKTNTPPAGPMLGSEAYKHFYYPDTAHYWAKVRALAHAYFRRRDAAVSELDATKLTTHLNAGTAAVGKSAANTVEPPYLMWIARLLDGPLQPKTVVFLGYVGHIKRQAFRDVWADACGLKVDWTKPHHVPLANSIYKFRRWRCTNAVGGPLDLFIWPNHPSRPVKGHTWAAMVDAFVNLTE